MDGMMDAPEAVDLLLKLGDTLARSVGHNMRCPKVSPAIPCTCGEGDKQAAALDAWDRLSEKLRTEGVDFRE